MGDEVEVRQVDGGHDEGHEGIAAVVFSVGEDGDFGLEESHFCLLSESVHHSLFHVNNVDVLKNNNIPTSPATSESRPLNTTSQSANSSGRHSLTTISATSPMGEACFHRTASLYFLPAERDEAPIAYSSRVGWPCSRRMKRWPTEPVQPRTPED